MIVLYLLVCFFFASYSCQDTAVDPQLLETHSICAPYIDDGLQTRWFDFGGDTIIDRLRHIRLTSDKPSQQGYLWSRMPLKESNFEITVSFNVGHKGARHLYGDGFAIWLTAEKNELGPVFGSKNQFNGLGVFFDTYRNYRAASHSFPYISAMLGDGVKSYDNDKDGQSTELAGCESEFRGTSHPVKARIVYYKDNYLQLQMQAGIDGSWRECFKVQSVSLPEVFYLGFSAHTGELSDNHDIISIETTPLQPAQKESRQMHKSTKEQDTNTFSNFIKIVFLCLLLSLLFVGYSEHTKNQQRRF
ncbi:lectin family integral membrane [Pilobolus umbonatus]|nr:lectin family integral membrane [Pilobolus umbonatus]